jgi:O-antigen ligase
MTADLAAPKPTLAARLLGWAAVALLAGHISGAMACLYEQGQMPVKPRDFTLGLAALCGVLVFFNRPTFKPAVLALLLIPTLRLLDSALLKRFTSIALGDHGVAVMILANVWIVTVIGLLVLSTEHWQKIALRAAIVVIVLGSGSILFEGMGLAKYSQIDGRAAGFVTQPNEAIIVVCLMLGIVLTLNQGFWSNALIIGVAAIGVGLTLSRSGLVVFALMVMLWLASNLRQHTVKILLIVGLSIPAVIGGFAVLEHMASSRNFGTDTNAKDRVEAITGIFTGNTDKMESGERNKDLKDGWEGVTEAPLFGHGTGCASSHWQPHNQWVAIWLDIGVGGLLLYAGTLLFLTLRCLLASGRGIFALAPLWLFSVFSQNLVEMAGYWFCAGVAASVMTTSRFKLVLRREAEPPPVLSAQF